MLVVWFVQQRRVHEEGVTGPPRVGLEWLKVMRWWGRMWVRVCSTSWSSKPPMSATRYGFGVAVFQGAHAVPIRSRGCLCPALEEEEEELE